jgi:acyl dehydratase
MTSRTLLPIEVGTELAPLVLPPIRRSTLREYADASGDRNPLHLDPAAARASGEPDVIAHGMLSMAYAGRLVTTRLPGWELGSWQLRFTAKTPLGARVTCRGRVAAVHADVAVLDISVELDDGTTTAVGEARCVRVPERTKP